MTAVERIERALAQVIDRAEGTNGPPGLAAAVRYAVFPGGARIRPRLCLAVAKACGEDSAVCSTAAACSIELLHCASLVHDDLPCFDDAALRRGKPSVPRAFGERLAVLAGDALIVLAFQSLARAGDAMPRRLPGMLLAVARAAGMPMGIVAGQAWECEPSVPLSDYQKAKTAALFAAATAAGAAASGADPGPWHTLGERIGEAYQVADDLRDCLADAEEIGKPVGQDARLGRPNAVHELGVAGAVARLEGLVTGALDSMPACAGAAELRAHILAETHRLLPRKLARPAA